MLCSGGCLDVSADAVNCGTCGRACPAGIACVDGDCACPAGFCGGECVNLQSSRLHCGECGRFCNSECVDGECLDCGYPGEACCPTTGCEPGPRADCVEDVCVACGSGSQACCVEGDPCSSGLACDGGMCPECGSLGELCCRDDRCFGSECDGGMCTMCGSRGEPCCVDSDATVCDHPSDRCSPDGTCAVCGGEGQQCCLASSGDEFCSPFRTCSDDVCTSFERCDPRNRNGCGPDGCYPETDISGICYLAGTTEPGEACTIANECVVGSICLARGVCAILCDRVDGVPGCPGGFVCGGLTGFERTGVCVAS